MELYDNPGVTLMARLEKLDAAQDRIGARITHVERDQKSTLKKLHEGFAKIREEFKLPSRTTAAGAAAGASAVKRLRAGQKHAAHQEKVGKELANAAINRALARAAAESAAADKARKEAAARTVAGRVATARAYATAGKKGKKSKKAKAATKANPHHARLPRRARTSHGFVL